MWLTTILGLLLTTTGGLPSPAAPERAMMKSLTPVLVVDAIEPCIPFWERLGFEKTIEVPREGQLGFLALQKDAVEVMYQTRASALEDVKEMARIPFGGPTHLYIQVDDFDAVERALEGVEVVVPRRVAPYGATEIFVLDGCGHFIGFAQMPGEGAGGVAGTSGE